MLLACFRRYRTSGRGPCHMWQGAEGATTADGFHVGWSMQCLEGASGISKACQGKWQPGAERDEDKEKEEDNYSIFQRNWGRCVAELVCMD